MTEWSGEWADLTRWVEALFPPKFNMQADYSSAAERLWPHEVEVHAGPIPEMAALALSVEVEDLEAVDFAREVHQQIRGWLEEREENKTQITLTLRAKMYKPSTQEVVDGLQPWQGTFRRIPVPAGREDLYGDHESDDGYGYDDDEEPAGAEQDVLPAKIAQRLAHGARHPAVNRTEDVLPQVPFTGRHESPEWGLVLSVVGLMRDEVAHERRRNEELVGTVLDTIKDLTRRSEQEATRSAQEAAALRNQLAASERVYLEERAERKAAEARAAAYEDQLERYEQRESDLQTEINRMRRRIKRQKQEKGDSSTDLFNKAVEQVMAAVQARGVGGPAEEPVQQPQPQPAPRPAPPPAPLPGAPIGRRRPLDRPSKAERQAAAARQAAAPTPAPAPPAAAGFDPTSLLSDPKRAAAMLAAMPENFRNETIDAFTQQFPQQAIELGERMGSILDNVAKARGIDLYGDEDGDDDDDDDDDGEEGEGDETEEEEEEEEEDDEGEGEGEDDEDEDEDDDDDEED